MSQAMYVRLPDTIKAGVLKYAQDNAKTMAGAAAELLKAGLDAAGRGSLVTHPHADIEDESSATSLRRRFVQSIIGLSNSAHGGNCSLAEVEERGDTSQLVFVFHQPLKAMTKGGEWDEYGRLLVTVRLPVECVRRR